MQPFIQQRDFIMKEIFHKSRLAFSHMRISRKLLLYYVATILLPLILAFSWFYSFMRSYVYAGYVEEKQRVVKQAEETIAGVESSMQSFVYMLEGNMSFMLYMIGGYRSASAEVCAVIRDIDPMVGRYFASDSKLVDVNIYRYKNSAIPATKYVHSAEDSGYALQTLQSLLHDDSLVSLDLADGRVLLDIVMPVSKNGTIKNVGVCQCTVDITEMLENVSVLSSEKFVISSGGVYLCKTSGGEYTQQITEDEFLALTGECQAGSVEEFNLDLYLFSERFKMNAVEVFLVVLVFVVCLSVLSIVFYFVLVMSLHPIVQFSTYLQREAIDGQVRPVDIPHNEDEAGELIEIFNLLSVRNMKLTEEVIQEALRRRQAEYYALQSQIKPHFLFNFLQRVSVLVYMDRKEQANGLLQKFGEFLRYSIKKDSAAVSLDMELLHARNYLDIMQDIADIHLTETVDPSVDCREILCPQFILQPVVENAVKYNASGKLSISVEVRREKSFILVFIRNNGTPIREEVLRGLKHKLALSSPEFYQQEDVSSGIGLVNVNLRLRYFYGAKCGLELENMPQGGVSVKLRLGQKPLEESKGENHECTDR